MNEVKNTLLAIGFALVLGVFFANPVKALTLNTEIDYGAGDIDNMTAKSGLRVVVYEPVYLKKVFLYRGLIPEEGPEKIIIDDCLGNIIYQAPVIYDTNSGLIYADFTNLHAILPASSCRRIGSWSDGSLYSFSSVEITYPIGNSDILITSDWDFSTSGTAKSIHVIQYSNFDEPLDSSSDILTMGKIGTEEVDLYFSSSNFLQEYLNFASNLTIVAVAIIIFLLIFFGVVFLLL